MERNFLKVSEIGLEDMVLKQKRRSINQMYKEQTLHCEDGEVLETGCPKKQCVLHS